MKMREQWEQGKPGMVMETEQQMLVIPVTRRQGGTGLFVQNVSGAMQQLMAFLLLLLLTCFFHPALGLYVSCLWEESFHIGHNVSGACQIHRPTPPGCQGQSLHLAADGQFLLPYHHTPDTGNFTVPAAPGPHLHLRCELHCPGPEPNKTCDITIQGGYPPSPPSRPQCHIPSDEHNLHCFWSPGGDPQLPTDYILHWEHTETEFPGSITVTTTNAIIPRKQFYVQSYISVWVIARNGLGSEQSQKTTFNTGDVVKPRPPVITEPIAYPTNLLIMWDVTCPTHMMTDMDDISCQAQYHRQDQDIWTEGEDVAQNAFLLEGLQAFSVYMFRVRCACPGSNQLMSDWTDTYPARTTEAAPVGVLDVWCDSREIDQAVVWKELPVSMARGIVLGYLVAVERAGGNRTVLNVSAAELGVRNGGSADAGPCCRLPLSHPGGNRGRRVRLHLSGPHKPCHLGSPHNR
ncbi:hypothetical protein SKAU_G00119110 [Synaphobranchus kaupii]|uniref:Fibronectin type-III domain-containing protein n=1 Tax=Synaphobranchus kaupii TaxID=118154 RepID=A0A9Q1J2B6_SYNKA|nr:hypothetical protein SKAU_G00119110 [Synaphobranchus kaupii]